MAPMLFDWNNGSQMLELLDSFGQWLSQPRESWSSILSSALLIECKRQMSLRLSWHGPLRLRPFAHWYSAWALGRPGSEQVGDCPLYKYYLQIVSKNCGVQSANWAWRNYCCCIPIIHVWGLHPSRGHLRDLDEHGDAGHNDAAGCYSRCGNRHRRGYLRRSLGYRQMNSSLRGFWVSAPSRGDRSLASMLFTSSCSAFLRAQYMYLSAAGVLRSCSLRLKYRQYLLLELHDYTT